MKKIATLILLLILTACSSAPYVELGNVKVQVEVPATPAEMARGLMQRESLGKNAGMIFVFEKEAKHSFWMKNTLIPLDLIFIDDENKIVDILNAVPCKKEPCEHYIPKEKALYVLEVNNGFAQKHKIEIGEEVNINI